MSMFGILMLIFFWLVGCFLIVQEYKMESATDKWKATKSLFFNIMLLGSLIITVAFVEIKKYEDKIDGLLAAVKVVNLPSSEVTKTERMAVIKAMNSPIVESGLRDPILLEAAREIICRQYRYDLASSRGQRARICYYQTR